MAGSSLPLYHELGRDQIRLLKIRETAPDGMICCELHTVDFSQAPLYAAISYTWGQPLPLRPILINGCEVAVREDCQYALWQVIQHALYEYVWIDAICESCLGWVDGSDEPFRKLNTILCRH